MKRARAHGVSDNGIEPRIYILKGQRRGRHVELESFAESSDRTEEQTFSFEILFTCSIVDRQSTLRNRSQNFVIEQN